jgi:hypothetical protein
MNGQITNGLPPGEAAFLTCSFWLVDNYISRDAIRSKLFEISSSTAMACGVLAEEFDPLARMRGNFRKPTAM